MLTQDHPAYDAVNAIEWALDYYDDGPIESFLKCWQEGDFEEFPDYVAWASVRS